MSTATLARERSREDVLAAEIASYPVECEINRHLPASAGWRRIRRHGYVTWTRKTLGGQHVVVLDRSHVEPGSWRVTTPAVRGGWRAAWVSGVGIGLARAGVLGEAS